MEEEKRVIKLKAIEATPESFKEYGQVIEVMPDHQKFGPLDAQLDLSRGTPRLYIMHIPQQKPKFSSITHHANVTQCLGSVGGYVWYLGIAKASVVNRVNVDDLNKKIVKSPCGHLYVPPSVDEVQAFRISGIKFLKLNAGTWHVGPLFWDDALDFYNLELTNTNEVDHTRHLFDKENGVVFEIDD